MAAASPRSRGWTRGRVESASTVEGFPALAGMDPPAPSIAEARDGLPRARGDGPVVVIARAGVGKASPRSRGWTLLEGDRRSNGGGFPALAGMDPYRPTGRRSRARLPRARGDGPAAAPAREFEVTASPRSRGWTRDRAVRRGVAPGFPALAGMDPRLH